MSYERCFGGFAGHNVDRRLWAGSGPTGVAGEGSVSARSGLCVNASGPLPCRGERASHARGLRKGCKILDIIMSLIIIYRQRRRMISWTFSRLSFGSSLVRLPGG